MDEMLLPLQGVVTYTTKTQGSALGYRQIAPSGRTSECRIYLLFKMIIHKMPKFEIASLRDAGTGLIYITPDCTLFVWGY